MASSPSQKIFSHFSTWTAFLVLPTACMQKMYKESGVCGQLLCQPRASSAMAEICAACSLSAYMSSDLVRRRRMTMGARSRLCPLQIKPLVCPALEWRGPGGRASSGWNIMSKLTCTESQSLSDIWYWKVAGVVGLVAVIYLLLFRLGQCRHEGR